MLGSIKDRCSPLYYPEIYPSCLCYAVNPCREENPKHHISLSQIPHI